MELFNYNDIIRKYILNEEKAFEIKTDEEYDCYVDSVYDKIKNKSCFPLLIGVMYLTSYMVNYVMYKRYPDDEEILNDMLALNSFSSIEELINSMNNELFAFLYDDLILFEDLSYYIKKQCVIENLDNKNELMKIMPIFMYDIISYGKEYTASYITDEYKKRYIDCKDEKVALEDSICFGIEFLIELEGNDRNNYEKIFYDIVEKYYDYNKHLLSQNKELDEYATDIMELIEGDVEILLSSSINNGMLLEPIVRDFLSYELLPKEEKEKVKKFGKIKP